MRIDGPSREYAAACEAILRALPEWFGIEASTAQYVRDTGRMPTFVAVVDEVVGGFITINRHFPFAAEVQVIGVRPEMHRRGIGRALLVRAEAWLVGEGVEFLQVKTVGPSSDDMFYARTRLFYEGVGFRALEELPTLWDERNPCLVMVKRVGG